MILLKSKFPKNGTIDFDSLTKQYNESNSLIEQMKKDNADNKELQTKITDYESKIEQMKSELKKTKLDSALKVALLEAKATDIDYLTFKIKEKGEIMLDDNGKIKGLNDTISELKSLYPNQFSIDQKKKIDVNKLPKGDLQTNGITQEQFNKMGYQERLKLFTENPEAYNSFVQK